MILQIKKSELGFKAIASYITLGANLTAHSVAYTVFDIKSTNIFPLIFVPIVMNIGAFIFLIPIVIIPKDFTKSLKYWMIMNVGILGYQLAISLLFIFNNFGFDVYGVALSFLLIYTYLEYINFKSIRSYYLIIKPSGIDKELDKTLGIFSKPQKFDKLAELQHIYIILKNGITIYSKSLRFKEEKARDDKDMIMGSAITAIETFLKEMYESKTVLKEVKQESISIILEEGDYVRIAIIASKDQKILRKKMINFLTVFENEFKLSLRENMVDTRIFEPVDNIINEIFK